MENKIYMTNYKHSSNNYSHYNTLTRESKNITSTALKNEPLFKKGPSLVNF